MPGRIHNYERCFAVTAILLLAACLGACALASKPLPSDFPLSKDLLPADAWVRVAYSSQQKPLDYGKVDLPAGREAEVIDIMKTHWNIVFTTKQSELECQDHLAQILKEQNYRYADRPAPRSEYFSTDTIRFYFAPDANLAVAQVYSADKKMFCLLVIKNDQFNKRNYQSAKAIE